MWETEPAPASFTLFGVPDLKTESTKYAIEIPWVLGLIATRSLDTPVEGIHPLVEKTEQRIHNGLPAYAWLKESGGGSVPIPAELKSSFTDLGYAFLLKGVRPDAENATMQDIKTAAHSVIPNVPVLSWAFRIMVGLGFYFIALFGAAFYLSSRRRIRSSRLFLRIALYSLPLPWVAAELGWIVAEYGRQPWIIDGVMPTFLGVSNIPASNVWASLIRFLSFYTSLAIVDMGLILKYVRLGPEEKGYAPTSGRRRVRGEAEHARLWNPSPHLVGARRHFTDRLCDSRRLRPRRRDAASFRRAQRYGAAGDDERDRPGLGRQSGLVRARRRRGLRRLAGALFRLLLRLLSRDDAGVDRLHLWPVALTYRSKRPSPGWRAFWDWAFFVSSLIPSLVFGVAFGNLLLGAPFHFENGLNVLYEGNLIGLLNPFALLCGFVSIAMLVMQGGSFLAVKTEGEVAARARRFGGAAGILLALLFVLAGILVAKVIEGYVWQGAPGWDGPSNPTLKTVAREPGAWIANYGRAPFTRAFPILGLLGAAAAAVALSFGYARTALSLSSLAIAGVILTAGASSFPLCPPRAIRIIA